jgi:hypothetical protein
MKNQQTLCINILFYIILKELLLGWMAWRLLIIFLTKNRSRIYSILSGLKPIFFPCDVSIAQPIQVTTPAQVTAPAIATTTITQPVQTISFPVAVQESMPAICLKSGCCSKDLTDDDSAEKNESDASIRFISKMFKDQAEALENYSKEKLRKRGGTPAPQGRK